MVVKIVLKITSGTYFTAQDTIFIFSENEIAIYA